MKFNREKSKEFVSIEINEKQKIEKFGKIVLTSFGIVLILFGNNLNNTKDITKEPDKLQVIISEYDTERAKYLEKVIKYEENFNESGLLDFYKNGKLIVTYNETKIEVNLKALYLRYGEINNEKFIFLSNVLNGRNVDFFTNKNNLFAEDYSIIEFRKTTIFEQLYKNHLNLMLNNTMELNEQETLELISMINNWDGKINELVPETKAVENKQIWEGMDEKKR